MRAFLLAVGFSLVGISTRVITPNGDGLNDTVVFIVDNPKDSAAAGKVFDLWGSLVAEMTKRGDGNLEWNGRSRGSAVSSGVYVYQIQSEEKTFTGAVLVIR